MQAYALQSAIRKLGHEVRTIDLSEKMPTSLSKVKYLIISIVKKYIFSKDATPFRHWPTKQEQDELDINTWDFINNNITLTEKVNNTQDLKRLAEQYDYFIVGSDQVWRKEYLKEITRYYFDFLPDETPRISYAASFGKTELDYNANEIDKCKELIKKFKRVSVREYDGVEICKNYFKIDPYLVLDPTLLINKGEYEALIDNSKINPNLIGKKFALAYVLDQAPQIIHNINKYCQELNLDVYFINVPKFGIDKKIPIDDCIFPHVSTWLYAFKNAEYVFTDSFHGSVFSIIFERQFFVFDNPNRGSSRLISLLNTFNLLSRLIQDDCHPHLQELIDYSLIKHKLYLAKSDSINFLDKAINEGKD